MKDPNSKARPEIRPPKKQELLEPVRAYDEPNQRLYLSMLHTAQWLWQMLEQTQNERRR